MKQILLIFLPILALVGCASTSNPPGPEGTGDHKDGYYLGRSDTAKQQYWMVQNLQKQPKEFSPQTSYLPVTVGGAETNGVITVPHTEFLRIDQPNLYENQTPLSRHPYPRPCPAGPRSIPRHCRCRSHRIRRPHPGPRAMGNINSGPRNSNQPIEPIHPNRPDGRGLHWQSGLGRTGDEPPIARGHIRSNFARDARRERLEKKKILLMALILLSAWITIFLLYNRLDSAFPPPEPSHQYEPPAHYQIHQDNEPIYSI